MTDKICDYDEAYTRADADEIGWCRTSCGCTQCIYHPDYRRKKVETNVIFSD